MEGIEQCTLGVHAVSRGALCLLVRRKLNLSVPVDERMMPHDSESIYIPVHVHAGSPLIHALIGAYFRHEFEHRESPSVWCCLTLPGSQVWTTRMMVDEADDAPTGELIEDNEYEALRRSNIQVRFSPGCAQFNCMVG